MNQRLKKITALVLTLVMLMSITPLSVLADIVTDTSGGFSLMSLVPLVHTKTYEFRNGGTLVDTQIVKNGEVLIAPQTPAAPAGKKFVGWQVGTTPVVFGTAITVTTTETVTANAVFADVYYVFFRDDTGRVYQTVEGVAGTVVQANVIFPVANNKSITGWYTESGLINKVTSVTLTNANITLWPKVETGFWITYDSHGGTYIPPKFYTVGQTPAAPSPAPVRLGYNFARWSATDGGASAINFSNINTNTTVHAVWTAKTNTAYTVIHWQENADNTNYSFKESETKTGTTGANSSASAKTYSGFTAQAITQQVIAGDGTTIVNVYYTRNVYSVKFFRYNSGWSEMTALRITAKYEANISAQWPYATSAIWGTVQGSNSGQQPYQSGIDTMPLNGFTFYYVNQSGQYTMELHYRTEVLSGQTGAYTYNGKQYNQDHIDTFQSGSNQWSTTVEDHYPITGFTYTNNNPTDQASNRWATPKHTVLSSITTATATTSSSSIMLL